MPLFKLLDYFNRVFFGMMICHIAVLHLNFQQKGLIDDLSERYMPGLFNMVNY